MEQPNKFTLWAKEFGVKIPGGMKKYDAVFDEAGLLLPPFADLNRLEISAPNRNVTKYECPINANSWTNINRAEIKGFVIDDFTNIPNIKSISIYCTVESWKGLGKLDALEELHINTWMRTYECSLPSTMLGVMRAPNLKKLTVDTSVIMPMQPRARKALRTVAKAIEDQWSLLECMEQLIQIGLQEYAKI